MTLLAIGIGALALAVFYVWLFEFGPPVRCRNPRPGKLPDEATRAFMEDRRL